MAEIEANTGAEAEVWELAGEQAGRQAVSWAQEGLASKEPDTASHHPSIAL